MPALDTASDLDFRRTGIGGSDAPLVAGLRAYGKDVFSVYLEKIGQTMPSVQNEAMGVGHLLEDPLARDWGKRHGRKVRNATTHVDSVTGKRTRAIRHPRWPFLFAHLDRLDDEGNILEVKVVNNFKASDFGERDTDQVPPLIALQVHHQLGVVQSAKRANIIVLMGGVDRRDYVIERDQETIDALQTLEVDLWENNIIPRIPPMLDGSDGATDFLRQAFPNDDGTEIVATVADEDWADIFRSADIEIKALGARKALAQQHLMDRLAEASTMIGPDFRISYKRAKDSETTHWDRVAGYYADEPDYEANVSRFTEVKPGSRRFIFTDRSEA